MKSRLILPVMGSTTGIRDLCRKSPEHWGLGVEWDPS